MMVYSLFLWICLLKNVVFSSQTNDMLMAIDFVRFYEKPTFMSALVTWKPTEMIRFSKALQTKAGSTVTFLHDKKAIDNVPPKDVLFCFDLGLPNAEEILFHANAIGKFRSPNRWLIFGSNWDRIILSDIFNNLAILPDSEVVIASRNEANDTIILNMIYKISHERNWTLENFGKWKVNEGLTLSKDFLLSSSAAMRRKNLHQTLIKTITVGGDKNVKPVFDSLRNTKSNVPTVASFWQIKPLFEFLNASIELTVVDSWGFKTNGTWSGMVGGMAHQGYDISGILLFMSKQRLEVVDYLAQPLVATIVFVFREPRLSYQNNLFLLPFKNPVWYTILGLVVLIILVLYIHSRWELKKFGGNGTTVTNETWLHPDIGDITIFAISAITQQGNSSELKGGLGRVVIFFLLLTCLFLYTAYSASIVVLLQSSSDQIRTLSDLLNSKLELGVEDTPYNKHYFMTETEPVRAAIYNKKIAPKGYKSNFMSIEEGVKKLQKEPFAFNMVTAVGYRVIEAMFHEHEKCGLREIAYIQANSPWYSCTKGSHYKEMYKVGLYRLKEHGMFDRVNNQFYSKKPVCSVRGGNFLSVSIVDFYPALLVLVYGSLCSLLLLSLEIVVHRRRGKRVA